MRHNLFLLCSLKVLFNRLENCSIQGCLQQKVPLMIESYLSLIFFNGILRNLRSASAICIALIKHIRYFCILRRFFFPAQTVLHIVRFSSARMMFPTFANCVALARELPPNFTTLIIFSILHFKCPYSN